MTMDLAMFSGATPEKASCSESFSPNLNLAIYDLVSGASRALSLAVQDSQAQLTVPKTWAQQQAKCQGGRSKLTNSLPCQSSPEDVQATWVTGLIVHIATMQHTS